MTEGPKTSADPSTSRADLPERIRASTERLANAPLGMSLIEWGDHASTFLNAADEIEHLRSEIARKQREIESLDKRLFHAR